MSKFTRELDELQSAGIITPEVAEKIKGYYSERPSLGSNLMVIAFGIIGALLVGMGIVLILAHNWDTLPNWGKLGAGFTPMFLAQAVAGFMIFKKIDNSSWRESISVVLTFSVGTAMAIVSQVYNLDGSFSDFLLTWAILTLPIIYVMRSWMASLLYWLGITWYAIDIGFGIFQRNDAPLYYWPLAIAAIPFYILRIRQHPNSNSIAFHSWVMAVSFTFVLGLGDYADGADLLVSAYITLFSVYMLIGQLPYFSERRLLNNAWLIGGSAGTIFLLLFLTFEWPDLSGKSFDWWMSAPLALWAGLFAAASFLLYRVGSRIGFGNVLSKSYTFIIFLVLFLIGLTEPGISRIVTNVLILVLGIYTIREGALADKLWKMNYGMLILSMLIICRFFDTNISFIARGLLFVGIGVGFFAMNFYVTRKRKTAAV
jgi:uncharacterized membrane protein